MSGGVGYPFGVIGTRGGADTLGQMQILIPLPLVMLLAGCSGAPEPARASRPSDQVAAMRADQARTAAITTTLLAQRASEDGARLEQAKADARAQQLSIERAAAKRLAERKAEEDAAIEARAAECTRTRPQRAADAQFEARSYVAWMNRISPQMKAIKARCKLTLTNTGSVNVQSSGSGFRVSPEKKEGVACAGGPPPGVTENDAWVFLSRAQPGGAGFNNRLIEGGGTGSCTGGDVEAGLDTSILEGDTDGIKKLLAWKPDPGASRVPTNHTNPGSSDENH